jgi:tetratricopeptide (TPR) repeat protein
MSSSPPKTSPLRRNTSGSKQRNQLAPAPLRRYNTAPVSRTPALRPSGPSRLSKIFAQLDDALSLSNHSSSSSRTNARASISSPIEFCLEEFDGFCCKILPKHVPDKALVEMLQCDVKLHLNNDPVTQGTFQEIELGLTSILEGTPSLPATIVAELLSYRGLVHLQRENAAEAAIESFTRALWLQSHMNNNSKKASPKDLDSADHQWLVALTKHRLGVAYGRSGNYLRAIDQIELAIQSYDKAGVSITDGSYAMVKEHLHDFQEAHQIALVRSSGRPIRTSMIRRHKSCDRVEKRPVKLIS